MNIDQIHEDNMKKFNKEIWETIFNNFDQGDSALIPAAVLVKIAIELYTVALEEDSEIEHLITQEIIPSIPRLREGMKRTTSSTVH